MTQRPLTEDEKAELDELNAAVLTAIKTRRIWLDTKMYECSSLQVGDDIYDVNSGRKLGKIYALYRFGWADRDDEVHDTSVSCSYEYETSPHCFDNTSRQVGVSFGTREDALSHAELQTSWLRNDLT